MCGFCDFYDIKSLFILQPDKVQEIISIFCICYDLLSGLKRGIFYREFHGLPWNVYSLSLGCQLVKVWKSAVLTTSVQTSVLLCPVSFVLWNWMQYLKLLSPLVMCGNPNRAAFLKLCFICVIFSMIGGKFCPYSWTWGILLQNVDWSKCNNHINVRFILANNSCSRKALKFLEIFL